jgi:putative acetyltransferase
VLTVRPEQPRDRDAIDGLHRLAFGGDAESRLVDQLRGTAAFIPELSLIAEQDALVAGHLLLSRVQIGAAEGLALAPMGVLPGSQRQGIGSALVREGLARARALGHRFVIVLGHPEYYPRFGFTPARARGLDCQWPVPDEAFMALELKPGALGGVRGRVRYAPAFDEL